MKRGREDDDDGRDLKRRKGMLDGSGSMPSPTFNAQMPPTAVASQRRR